MLCDFPRTKLMVKQEFVSEKNMLSEFLNFSFIKKMWYIKKEKQCQRRSIKSSIVYESFILELWYLHCILTLVLVLWR